MTIQLSTTVRDAETSNLASAIATGVIKLFSGSLGANCAAADPTGTLASGTLPGTAATSTNGVLTKSGTWQATGSASGTAASFRVYASNGTTCHIQGTVTATGGGGDLTLDNTSIANAQVITINTFQITAGNA